MTDSKKKTAGVIDAAYVAHLARIQLGEAEADGLQNQLEQIVEYVKKIGELDLSRVEPTFHAGMKQADGADSAGVTPDFLRADETKPGLEQKAALENAPSSAKEQFIVPKIVE